MTVAVIIGIVAFSLLLFLGVAYVRPQEPFINNPWQWSDASDPQFTVGALVGTTITVNVVLYQNRQPPIGVYAGQPVTKNVAVQWYISSDAAGAVPATASGGVVAGTNGAIISNNAGLNGIAMVNPVNGEVDFAITESAPENLYLNIVLPTGGVKTSPVLAF
jgi:hypothetical protein